MISPVFVFGQSYASLGFEQNTGAYPPAVHFIRRAPGTYFYVTRDSIVLYNGVRIRLAPVDAGATVSGDLQSPIIFNSYRGSDSSSWRTNVPLFDAVRLNGIYPGVDARVSTSPQYSLNRVSLVLTLQPGADLSRFRLSVLNTGANPFEAPGGIWYTGGRLPGVFNVSVQATQAGAPLAASLRIESPDVLSVAAPSRAPSLPTQVEIFFPSYESSSFWLPPKSEDGNRYLTSYLEERSDFGEDGASARACTAPCTDSLLIRIGDDAKPVWASLHGGSEEDSINIAKAAAGGVAVAGTTRSKDLPVTPAAPHSMSTASLEVYLAFFDRDSGSLQTATYAGLGASAWPSVETTRPAGDIIVGGGTLLEESDYSSRRGYLIGWDPVENRIAFSLQTDFPVVSAIADTESRVYYAASRDNRLAVGGLDAAGRLVAPPALIQAPPLASDAQARDVRLLADPTGDLWVAYQWFTNESHAANPLWIAKVAPTAGQARSNRKIAGSAELKNIALTPDRNLKVLTTTYSPEVTSPDAPLVAACPDTSYFAILSPAGELQYATYVPNPSFDFDKQNVPLPPAQPSVACFANTAGRYPTVGTAPGQMITITGGGFGPAEPMYFSPDAGGNYPLSAAGFHVRIAGLDAPIIAVARGVVAVQVPYEVQPSEDQLSIEVSENGSPLNAIPFRVVDTNPGLFDTGNRENALGLPHLAALNEDGTVNSENNPAAEGSIVSVFGTGLGRLTPALSTGTLSPIPPAAPLSETELYRTCLGCQILYLGSAPGLSTAVFQANVRIANAVPGAGVRPHGIGIAAATNPRYLIITGPIGVVFVK